MADEDVPTLVLRYRYLSAVPAQAERQATARRFIFSSQEENEEGQALFSAMQTPCHCQPPFHLSSAQRVRIRSICDDHLQY